MNNIYINKEIAKLRFTDWYHETYTDDQVIKILDDIPAADVIEIRHGYWIKQPPDFDLCGVAYYQCSECGKEQQTPSNYCQFCGAKMKGEQKDVR